MKNCYIIRYGELALKGKNRVFFEKCLEKNIRECLKRNKINFDMILRIRGRMFVFSDENCDVLKDVFGIVSISFAIQTDFKIVNIKKTVSSYFSCIKGKSFRVRTQRADKNFVFDSMKLDKEIGAYVVAKTGSKVDLNNYDVELGIEIFESKVYVFADKIRGYGGMPLGSGGKVICLYENKKSLLAAWKIMRRGTIVDIVGFKDFKIGFLSKFDHGVNLRKLIFDEFSSIEKYAKQKGIDAIVVSQTLDNFKKIDTELVVLRPLITLSEPEILDEMVRLG